MTALKGKNLELFGQSHLPESVAVYDPDTGCVYSLRIDYPAWLKNLLMKRGKQ